MAMNVTPFQSSDSFNMAGFNNMISQINSGVDSEIANLPKVVFGSYVGTGLSGEDNPCVLTFDFAPKIVCVSDEYGILASVDWADNFFINACFVESWPSTFDPAAGFGLKGQRCGRRSEDGKTISWYNSISVSDSAGRQLNESGKTYYYMAIG